MLCICKYDPIKDISPVDPTGWVDLAQANAMNSLPANLQVEQLSFNEIEDPNSIGGRPSDVFEAAAMSKSIADYVPEKE